MPLDVESCITSLLRRQAKFHFAELLDGLTIPLIQQTGRLKEDGAIIRLCSMRLGASSHIKAKKRSLSLRIPSEIKECERCQPAKDKFLFGKVVLVIFTVSIGMRKSKKKAKDLNVCPGF